MNNTPFVSVIITAFNAEDSIKESIQSVLDQTFSDFELLIADDCSTDNTKNIINSFKDDRINCFHNKSNMHVCWTWNNLIKFSRGKYLTFQDADDISYPHRLEKLVTYAMKYPEFAIIGANHLRPFLKWDMHTVSKFSLNHSDIIDKIIKTGEINSCGPRSLFLSSVVQEFNGFRPIFDKVGWEDFDLILRISEKYKIVNIPDVLYEYRYEPNSYSRINYKSLTYKKFFIHEIGLFLYNQRLKNNGVDALMDGGDKSSFDAFLKLKKNSFNKDLSLPLRKLIRNQCANKDFKNAFLTNINAIKIKPFAYKNWLIINFVTQALLRTCIKYFLYKFKVLR